VKHSAVTNTYAVNKKFDTYTDVYDVYFPSEPDGEMSAMSFLIKSAGCPNCGSASVWRSRRRGFREFLLHLLHIEPYRCWECDERHFRFRKSDPQPADSATPNPAH